MSLAPREPNRRHHVAEAASGLLPVMMQPFTW